MTVPCHQKFSDKPFDYCQKPVTISINGKYYCQDCAKRIFNKEAPSEPIKFYPKP